MKILIQDMRAAGVCVDAKPWMESKGLSFWDFARNGIDSAVLREVSDNISTIERLEKAAAERIKNGRK